MNYYVGVLKNYAVFSGRARRAEYWYFVLFNAIAGIVLSIISKIIVDNRNILGGLYSLAILLPMIAVSIRRLHDTGKSGWWVLLTLLIIPLPFLLLFIFFIPILGFLSLICLAALVWYTILMCKDSNPGDNKYGPNPKSVPASPIPPTPPASTPVQ